MKRLNSSYPPTLYYIFLHILFFFYIYSIQFVGAMQLGTRVFLGFFGMLLFLYSLAKEKLDLRFDKKFIPIYINLLAIFLISLITVLYNNTNDYEFIKYPISIILILFSSYFVVNMASVYQSTGTVSGIIKIIINVVFIQVILSVLMFIIPELRDFLNSIQDYYEIDLKMLEGTLEFRLVGFGTKFFGSGIVNGFALILITTLIRIDQCTSKTILRYSFIFLFIFAFGMMMARTTIIGLLFSLVILFFPIKNNNFKKSISFITTILVTLLVSVILLFTFIPQARETLQDGFEFGFEMFLNYSESGSLESESTNELQKMYIWPTTLKTYLIGDGYYTDIRTGLYYKDIDVGFLRLIYYFGTIGFIIYLLLQFQVARLLYLKNNQYKILFLVLFMYCLVLNAKGFTDIFYLSILLCYGLIKNKEINE